MRRVQGRPVENRGVCDGMCTGRRATDVSLAFGEGM